MSMTPEEGANALADWIVSTSPHVDGPEADKREIAAHAVDVIAAAAQAAREDERATLLERLDEVWAFDDGQQHRHSWHCKQDFIEWARARQEK